MAADINIPLDVVVLEENIISGSQSHEVIFNIGINTIYSRLILISHKDCLVMNCSDTYKPISPNREV